MNDHAAHSSARTSKLNVLGLGDVDAAVYQILLQTPHRAPDDLADHLNTSSEAICRALGNLERLSLVRPSPKHPGAHRSVSPEVGLAALLDKHEADLVKRYREVDETRRAINSLAADYAQWRAARSKGETEIIDTVDDGHDQLENLTAGAQTEILSFRPGVFSPGAMDVCRAVDTDRIKPHVKRRTLYLEHQQQRRRHRLCPAADRRWRRRPGHAGAAELHGGVRRTGRGAARRRGRTPAGDGDSQRGCALGAHRPLRTGLVRRAALRFG